MDNNLCVPNKDEKVVVNLTVKEILALSGDKFGYDHLALIEARRKIRQQLEQHQQ